MAPPSGGGSAAAEVVLTILLTPARFGCRPLTASVTPTPSAKAAGIHTPARCWPGRAGSGRMEAGPVDFPETGSRRGSIVAAADFASVLAALRANGRSAAESCRTELKR